MPTLRWETGGARPSFVPIHVPARDGKLSCLFLRSQIFETDTHFLKEASRVRPCLGGGECQHCRVGIDIGRSGYAAAQFFNPRVERWELVVAAICDSFLESLYYRFPDVSDYIERPLVFERIRRADKEVEYSVREPKREVPTPPQVTPFNVLEQMKRHWRLETAVAVREVRPASDRATTIPFPIAAS